MLIAILFLREENPLNVRFHVNTMFPDILADKMERKSTLDRINVVEERTNNKVLLEMRWR